MSALAREQQRIQKANERARQATEKDAKRLRAEARQAEVEAKNDELNHQLQELESILAATLDVDDFVDFETLKETPRVIAFTGPPADRADPPPRLEAFIPAEPSGIGRFLGAARARHAQQVEEAKRRFEQALEEHAAEEARRAEAIRVAREEHEASARKAQEEVAKQHAEIDQLKRRFQEGDPGAVAQYFTGVLEASTFPASFPRHTKMAFVPESGQLVVELQLPSVGVVPSVKGYKS